MGFRSAGTCHPDAQGAALAYCSSVSAVLDVGVVSCAGVTSVDVLGPPDLAVVGFTVRVVPLTGWNGPPQEGASYVHLHPCTEAPWELSVDDATELAWLLAIPLVIAWGVRLLVRLFPTREAPEET